MFNFHISSELRDSWPAIAVKHTDFYLLPVRSCFRTMTLEFFLKKEKYRPENIYCCHVKLKSDKGIDIHITTENSNGEIAITDALARARRTMVRSSQRLF